MWAWCEKKGQKGKVVTAPSVNHFICQVKDQADEIASLKVGLVNSRERVGVLEMSSAMIQTQVKVLEETMEIDPPLTDLTSKDLDYQDVDDGGVMLVEDSKEERDQENIAPVCLDTPHSAPIIWSLILIKDLAPLAPAVEVVRTTQQTMQSVLTLRAFLARKNDSPPSHPKRGRWRKERGHG
jgi:hypothetical protein